MGNSAVIEIAKFDCTLAKLLFQLHKECLSPFRGTGTLQIVDVGTNYPAQSTGRAAEMINTFIMTAGNSTIRSYELIEP